MRGAAGNFADSRLTRLSGNEDNTRTTFLVQSSSSLYILQASASSSESAEEVKGAYATAQRLQCLAGSLLRPFSLEEGLTDGTVRASALYRSDSKLMQNLCAGEILDGKTLMETASSLLEAMALLEDKEVQFNEELMQLLDFDCLLRSPVYCSPEFHRSSQEKANGRLGVYCWGMLVYQLVARRSFEELEQEVEEYKRKDKDYAAFLRKVKDVHADSREKEFLVQLLAQVLDEEPSNRPSFSELKGKFKLELGKCNGLNSSLSQALDSEGERYSLLKDELLGLQNENSKFHPATLVKLCAELREAAKTLSERKDELYDAYRKIDELSKPN